MLAYRMLRRHFYFLMGLLIFLTSSCTPVQPAPTTAPTNQVVPIEEVTTYPAPSYPPPVANPYNPYPGPSTVAPVEIVATPGSIPAPAADSGVVTGIILIQGAPAANLVLYLAEIISDAQGNERIASYDRTKSPKAYSDAQGNFVFNNIKPGRYSLVLDTIATSYLLHEPKENIPFKFLVETGKTTDLGTNDYESLPVPKL